MKFSKPGEIKALSQKEAKAYCESIRALLVERVSENGGHLASNLGIVEISMALVRGMNLPREKVIYDTGHQSYVHKILTGRGDAFATLRILDGISGFPRREESAFDAFGTGHSGTGISAALGFAKANRLLGDESFTVCVIGDGAFTGGMVFEALNNLSPHDRVIVILNDNGMSISQSVGSLKGALNSLRTAGYYRFKDGVQEVLSGIPFVGEGLAGAARKVKNSVKRAALPMGNLFEQLGLHYFGPANGNDLGTVELLLAEAKKKAGPSLIHLCTKKGKGYEPAEKDPAAFHGICPKGEKKQGKESFSDLFGESLVKAARADKKIVAVTAAMGDGVGLNRFSRLFPRRFFDVGIAEEHALTFAAGLACRGLKPCVALYSTFYQRAFDQLLHDAALQKVPLVLALDRAGLCGQDGATHHGLFDLPLTLPIPGVKIYAPLSRGEMETALSRAFAEKEVSSVIRYAKGSESDLVQSEFALKEDVEWADFGKKPKIALVTFGRLTENAILACRGAQKEGKSVRLIRFFALKGFDTALLAPAFEGMEKILFAEEGMTVGGFSAYLKETLSQEGLLGESRILGVKEKFVPHGNTSLLLSRLGLGEEDLKKDLIRFAET